MGHGFMRLARRLLASVLTTLLVMFLLLTALFWTLNSTVGQRGVVKGWLDGSDIYDGVIDHAVTEVRKSVDNTDGPEIDRDMLARSIDKTFTPVFLQDKTEQILDSTYDWLEGTTPKLEFSIDLTQQKTDLAASLTEEMKARFDKLPACTNLHELNSFDPFTSTCQPPGLDEKLEEFENDFTNSQDFLPNPIIHANDLKVGNEGNKQSLEEALAQAPAWYQRARALVWYTALAAVLSAAGILLLSQSRRAGLKHLVLNLSMTAILLLVYGVMINRLSGFINLELAAEQIDAVKSLIGQITASFAAWSFKFAGIYGLLAAAGIIYLILTRKRETAVPEAEGRLTDDDTEHIETPQPPDSRS